MVDETNNKKGILALFYILAELDEAEDSGVISMEIDDIRDIVEDAMAYYRLSVASMEDENNKSVSIMDVFSDCVADKEEFYDDVWQEEQKLEQDNVLEFNKDTDE